MLSAALCCTRALLPLLLPEPGGYPGRLVVDPSLARLRFHGRYHRFSAELPGGAPGGSCDKGCITSFIEQHSAPSMTLKHMLLEFFREARCEPTGAYKRVG